MTALGAEDRPTPRLASRASQLRPATVLTARRSRATVRATVRRLAPAVRSARTALFALAGFGSLTAAAWIVALPLGLVAAGLSFFALEFLSQAWDGE